MLQHGWRGREKWKGVVVVSIGVLDVRKPKRNSRWPVMCGTSRRSRSIGHQIQYYTRVSDVLQTYQGMSLLDHFSPEAADKAVFKFSVKLWYCSALGWSAHCYLGSDRQSVVHSASKESIYRSSCSSAGTSALREGAWSLISGWWRRASICLACCYSRFKWVFLQQLLGRSVRTYVAIRYWLPTFFSADFLLTQVFPLLTGLA